MVQGKWGATSFTSFKKSNGIGSLKDQSVTQQPYNADSGIGVAKKREWASSDISSSVNNPSVASNVPRPKKFFKSRDTTPKTYDQMQELNRENISDVKLQTTSVSREESGMALSCMKL